MQLLKGVGGPAAQLGPEAFKLSPSHAVKFPKHYTMNRPAKLAALLFYVFIIINFPFLYISSEAVGAGLAQAV
jgi:hypothetical protein